MPTSGIHIREVTVNYDDLDLIICAHDGLGQMVAFLDFEKITAIMTGVETKLVFSLGSEHYIAPIDHDIFSTLSIYYDMLVKTVTSRVDKKNSMSVDIQDFSPDFSS
ncbi:MAG: hypothetical protein HY617_02350 [Candidatus Sungbacteria bacterium]|nr:hypothetical protein [Candidatus Sungbacteria bacterium]